MADQDQDPAPAPAPAQLAVAQVSPAGQLPADKGGQPESAAGPGAAAAAGDTGARDSEIGESAGAGGGCGPSTSRPAEHVVAGRETVASIAAMYEVTPSELVSANKLGMARLVFPGQVSSVHSIQGVRSTAGWLTMRMIRSLMYYHWLPC